MSPPCTCPGPERLWEGLDDQEACPACRELLESHRQLEKDLLRLSDPLPPSDFVQQVMARVQAEPAPARSELLTFLGILGAALAGLLALVVLDAGTALVLGTRFAGWAVASRQLLEGGGRGLQVAWETSALPLSAAAAASLLTLLLALRRLYGADPIKVTS